MLSLLGGITHGITLAAIAAVVFFVAYLVCGRWIEKHLGINPKALTPAYRFKDGQDFAPASRTTVLVRHFSSIAGAGVIAGPILGVKFGWFPVFLWLVLGGVFIGATQDFVVLYASVRNEGKSMSKIIEHYIGRRGCKLFLMFSWLFQLLLIAAFSDIIATAFNGFTPNGSRFFTNGVAGCISMLYILLSMGFGTFTYFVKPSGGLKSLIGFAVVVCMILFGLHFPLYFAVDTWRVILFNYCFVSAVLPTWLMTQPRDYLSFFLLIGLLLGGIAGVIVANPTIEAPAFVGFVVDGESLFPILFVTVGCGAISGFHGLVGTRSSSKTISNERDILPVGYGGMLIEAMLGVLALIMVSSLDPRRISSSSTPLQVFASCSGGFLSMLNFFGISLSKDVAMCLMKVFATGLAMTTIDSVSRISRLTLQEAFRPEPGKKVVGLAAVMSDEYIATSVTLILAYLLCLTGYKNIWTLFGAANQMLAAIVLVVLLVFLRETGRKSWILAGPGLLMLLSSSSALGLRLWGFIKKLVTGNFELLSDGIQCIILIALLLLGLNVVYRALYEFFTGKNAVERKAQLKAAFSTYDYSD